MHKNKFHKNQNRCVWQKIRSRALLR